MKNSAFLPYIEMIITTKCNRSCLSCSNYIPKIHDKAKHVPYEDIRNQLTLLMNKVAGIEKFQIHGGEPLLHPELPEIVSEVSKYANIREVRIATNGTVLPTQSLLNTLKGGRVKLAVSSYYFNKATSLKIEQMCRENDVPYIIYQEQKWYHFGEGKGMQFDQCPINHCPSLFEGKIYLCSRICHAYSHNGNDFYISLKDVHNVVEEMRNTKLKGGCRFCDFSNRLIEAGH